MVNTLQIELLADHIEAIPTLERWFELEWAPYYGPNGPGDAQKDIADSCNRDKLPVSLVAISDGKVCGTATLKTESGDLRDAPKIRSFLGGGVWPR